MKKRMGKRRIFQHRILAVIIVLLLLTTNRTLMTFAEEPQGETTATEMAEEAAPAEAEQELQDEVAAPAGTVQEPQEEEAAPAGTEQEPQEEVADTTEISDASGSVVPAEQEESSTEQEENTTADTDGSEENTTGTAEGEANPAVDGNSILTAEDFKNAVENAADGATIVLGADIDYDQGIWGTIAIQKNITIDFGEHKLSVEMGEECLPSTGLFDINSNAKLTLENAEIIQDGKNLIGTNDGTFIIESTKGNGISTECVIAINNGSVKVTDGTFHTTYCFVDECPGFMEIMNGVFRSDDYVFDSIGGRLIIHNADVEADGPCISVDSSPTVGEAEIFGGTFVAHYECVANYGKVTLYPGTSFKSTDSTWGTLYSNGGTFYVSKTGGPSVPMENWDTASQVEIVSKPSVQINWIGPAAEQVKVSLLSDGEVKQDVILNEENQWQHFFDVNMFDDNGEQITYKVDAGSLDGYRESISDEAGKDYTITYTKLISIPVTVNWIGGTGDQIAVHLLANGAEIAGQTFPVVNQVQAAPAEQASREEQASENTAEESWQYTFSNYDQYQKNDSGFSEINFSLTADSVSGYSGPSITGNAVNGFTVTYTKIQEENKENTGGAGAGGSSETSSTAEAPQQAAVQADAVNPSAPEQPGQAVAPAEQEKATEQDQLSPKTGDSSDMMIYLGVLIITALAMGADFAFIHRLHKRNSRKK